MKRFYLAVALLLACCLWVAGSSLWAEAKLNTWEELLEQMQTTAQQGQWARQTIFLDQLERSFYQAKGPMTLLFRKDLVTAFDNHLGSLKAYNIPDSEPDMVNALNQALIQLELLRRLFFGFG